MVLYLRFSKQYLVHFCSSTYLSVCLFNSAPMQSAPKSEVLLPCNASGLADITWTFNHNQPILRKRAGQEEPQVETEWQQHVGGLSESGSLLLHTTSAESAGTYTCTASYAEETDVTNTELKILENRKAKEFVKTVLLKTSIFTLYLYLMCTSSSINNLIVFIFSRLKTIHPNYSSTSHQSFFIFIFSYLRKVISLTSVVLNLNHLDILFLHLILVIIC